MRQNIDEVKNVLNQNGYSIHTIICDVMKQFNFSTLCWKCGISKQAGFSVTEILTLMIMLPLMCLKSINAFYRSKFHEVTKMKKDVIYRLKNSERFPWRRLLYGVAKKFQELCSNPEVQNNTAFIVDDTIDVRVGDNIENVSYVHDHATNNKGPKLGFKDLVLGFFDGKSITPLDFSIHKEKDLPRKKRKKQYKKECSKNSNGARRRQECAIDKITNALAMIKRAVKNGFIAKYVLTDSWFTSHKFIKTVREIKNGAMHVIGGIRRDRRKYVYDGSALNATKLIAKLQKEGKQKRCRKWNVRYFEVTVDYPGIGRVKLYICRFPYQKKWRLFISTNTLLDFVKMMEIYSIRWTIEVMFKELKQHLQLGKCQSRDFDAQIASVTVSLILYIFLSYYRRKNAYESLGGLFEIIKDELCEKNLAQRLWELFDELLQVVIDVVSECGKVDIASFRESMEYRYLKELFESSFLSNQILGVNIAA